MGTIIWKLSSGERVGQETSDQKLQLGMEYIEKLKNTGENILEVKNLGDHLEIIIEDK